MPSLSRFAFWSCLVGFVLFVHSASPVKFFSLPEESETAVFMFALVLTLVGALAYIVNGRLESSERSSREVQDSLWRQFDVVDRDIDSRLDRIHDSLSDLQSRKTSR